MQLSEYDKSRARFHLGVASPTGIPEQDARQFEQSFIDIRDLYTHRRIVEQLDRCDRNFTATDVTNEAALQKQIYLGDINRTRADWEVAGASRLLNEVYLIEVDKLAIILHVPNYRRPDIANIRRERAGAVYFQPVPGPADTAIMSISESILVLSGGAGY